MSAADLATLTDFERKTLASVCEVAERGIALMPTAIADRNACGSLMAHGLLDVVEARHEESGAEGQAYVLALRPAFNECVRLVPVDGGSWDRRWVVRAWRQRENARCRSLSPGVTWETPVLAATNLALWHACEAARERLEHNEAQAAAHLLTVYWIAKNAVVSQ